MPAPTAAARQLSARSRQPGHDRSWVESETSVADWCKLLLGADYEVTAQPRELIDLYGPRAGLIPELKLHCHSTGRYLYVEVKRQGPRGNAEERVYKLFTPAFMNLIRERTGLDYHPFVAVFCDELASLERYRVRFAAHLEAGSYLRWKDRDPMVLARFLDQVRARWLEPGRKPDQTCQGRGAALLADPCPSLAGALEASVQIRRRPRCCAPAATAGLPALNGPGGGGPP